MSEPRIALDSINLVVGDMSAARTFYERLGVQFANAHEPVWDRHHVTGQRVGGSGAEFGFDLDSASFANKWNVGWPGGAGVVIGFRVDSRQAVDDLVAELAAEGTPVQQPPWDAFWGARYAIVSDPDGNAVGIMSPVDPAYRSEAPDPE